MTNTQIRYFLAVGEELSFSQAARQFYVSQPAVSKQISLFEDELGFLLFDRTGKSIALTEAGALLKEYYSRMLTEYDQVIGQIKKQSDIQSGSVRVGCIETWNTSFFYDEIIAYFKKNHPRISISLEAYNVQELTAALRNEEIDVGFTYKFSLANQRDMEWKPFFTLKAGLLYSSSILKAAPEAQSLEDFKGCTFLVNTGSENVMERTVMDVCKSYGFRPRIRHCKRLSAEVTDVLCGTGVMLVDNWSYLKDNTAFKYLPLDYMIKTCVAYLPNKVNAAKNIFVNETMHLFDRKQENGN